MADDAAGPRIFVPPPLVFVGGWVISWILSSRVTFDIDGAGASILQTVLGLILMTGGLLLMAWGFIVFFRAGTPVVPVRPASRLVTEGPFRFTRNPMYLGLTAAYVGLAIVLNFAWPIVLLPLVLIVLRALVVSREEAHLRRRFGGEYAEYCANVRRWL